MTVKRPLRILMFAALGLLTGVVLPQSNSADETIPTVNRPRQEAAKTERLPGADAQNNPHEQEKRREPVGARLTGHAEKYGRTWPFEIVMEGNDYYYRKEWDGEQDPRLRNFDDRGFWNVSLVVGDFGGRRGESWSDFGTRGGGSYGQHGKDTFLVARRLWQGDTFRGVECDQLRAELVHYIEQFSEPVSHDDFPLPCVILWTDTTSSMPEKTRRYTVETVEFRYRRNPQFFEEVKAKYFPEAGPPPLLVDQGDHKSINDRRPEAIPPAAAVRVACE